MTQVLHKLAAFVCTAAALCAAPALAQDPWPARPITYVVPRGVHF